MSAAGLAEAFGAYAEDAAISMKTVSPEVQARRTFMAGAMAYRSSDPIICGRILGPNNKALTFFVAWWLDESDL